MGLVFACAVSMTSCGTKSRQASGNSDTAAVAVSVADTATAVVPVYAKGYAVKHLPGNVRLVDIHDPQKKRGIPFGMLWFRGVRSLPVFLPIIP